MCEQTRGVGVNGGTFTASFLASLASVVAAFPQALHYTALLRLPPPLPLPPPPPPLLLLTSTTTSADHLDDHSLLLNPVQDIARIPTTTIEERRQRKQQQERPPFDGTMFPGMREVRMTLMMMMMTMMMTTMKRVMIIKTTITITTWMKWSCDLKKEIPTNTYTHCDRSVALGALLSPTVFTLSILFTIGFITPNLFQEVNFQWTSLLFCCNNFYFYYNYSIYCITLIHTHWTVCAVAVSYYLYSHSCNILHCTKNHRLLLCRCCS